MAVYSRSQNASSTPHGRCAIHLSVNLLFWCCCRPEHQRHEEYGGTAVCRISLLRVLTRYQQHRQDAIHRWGSMWTRCFRMPTGCRGGAGPFTEARAMRPGSFIHPDDRDPSTAVKMQRISLPSAFEDPVISAGSCSWQSARARALHREHQWCCTR